MAHQLSDLELETGLEQSHLACETSPYRLLLLTFLSFAVFESAYVYAGIQSPTLTNTTIMDYPLPHEYASRRAEINIRLESFAPSHRFLAIFTALTRFSTFTACTYFLNVTQTVQLFQVDRLLDTFESSLADAAVAFMPGTDVSSELAMFSKRITDFDAVAVKMLLESNFSACRGLQFRYAFADANLSRFFSSIRIILSGCSLYALIAFLVCVRCQISSGMGCATAALGATAVLATNPASVFWPKVDFLNGVLMSVFLTFFRAFSLLIVRSIADHPFGITIFALALIVACGFAEGLGGVGNVLVVLHCCYGALILGLLTHAHRMAAGEAEKFQVVQFGLFIIVTVGMTILTEVAARTDGSSRSLLWYHSSHILSAIVFLFFQHAVAAGYERVPSVSTGNVQRMKDITFDSDDEYSRVSHVKSSTGESHN
jgi:hypothetical protein